MNLYRHGLSGLKCICVRESTGSEIVKKIISRDALVLLDPTLLIKMDEWLSISKEHQKKPKKKYALLYFLRKISASDFAFIERVAKKHNLKIVNLYRIEDKDYYNVDPAEFVDYINSANLVFTDSFHGTAFSILLKKPFISFKRDWGGDRKCMFSRIDNILKIFNMEDRFLENLKEKDIFTIDFSNVDSILDKERERALEYLNEALSLRAP